MTAELSTERAAEQGADALLRVEDLGVAFGRRAGRPGQQVLHGVSLQARAGEILGVIGETGSGKTTLARSVVGLSPVTGGRILVDGGEVTGLRGRALREFRRSGTVQYLFQDPLRSLDPDLTVAELIGEPLAVGGVQPRPFFCRCPGFRRSEEVPQLCGRGDLVVRRCGNGCRSGRLCHDHPLARWAASLR